MITIDNYYRIYLTVWVWIESIDIAMSIP